MWTKKALDEMASGWAQPIVTTEAPQRTVDPATIVLTWTCGDGHIIARSVSGTGYSLFVTCEHQAHRELVQYPLLSVDQVAVLEPSGAAVQPVALPTNADGYRLCFTVGPMSLQYPPTIRIELFPDPEGPLFTQIVEINAGTYAAPAAFDVTLNGKASRERQISIHVVDPRTARRDWGADGVEIWRRVVPVA